MASAAVMPRPTTGRHILRSSAGTDAKAFVIVASLTPKTALSPSVRFAKGESSIGTMQKGLASTSSRPTNGAISAANSAGRETSRPFVMANFSFKSPPLVNSPVKASPALFNVPFSSKYSNTSVAPPQ